MPETNFNFRLCFIDTWIFEFSLFSSPRLPPELLVEEIVPAQVTGVLSRDEVSAEVSRDEVSAE